jgi:hypothetical protein
MDHYMHVRADHRPYLPCLDWTLKQVFAGDVSLRLGDMQMENIQYIAYVTMDARTWGHLSGSVGDATVSTFAQCLKRLLIVLTYVFRCIPALTVMPIA